MSKVLPREFYERATLKVAHDLLGKIMCRRLGSEILRSRIVEVEAYLGIKDAAAHTFGGRKTERVRSMWLGGGHTYVYFIYGMYHCLNFVTRSEDHPEAVLIRAVEPLHPNAEPVARAKIPTNGPGKLCRHYRIDRALDGEKLWTKRSSLWVEDAPRVSSKNRVTATRVGVDYAGQAARWPLRFYISGNPFVSRA